MTANVLRHVADDRRRFVRVPLAGAVRYRYSPEESGVALASDVGRGGICLNLGRYLRPGRRIMLEVPEEASGMPNVELKAEVVWSRPSPGSRMFASGVRLIPDEAEAMSVISALVHKGLERAGASHASDTTPLCVVKWVPLGMGQVREAVAL